MKENLRFIQWDYVFLIWFLTESWFNHTIIGTLGQALFMLYSMYKCMMIKRFHWSALFSLYLVFCSVCFFNIWGGFAIAPSRSLLMAGVVLRNFIFIYFLYQYIQLVTSQHFLSFFTLACCMSSLGVLLLYFMSTGTLDMRTDGAESTINANIQSVINAFIISWLIISKQYKGKFFFIISFLFLFVLFSGTRKSIISIVVLVGGYLMLKQPRHIVRNMIGVIMLLLVLYVVLMKIPAIYDIIGNRFASLFSFMEGGDTDESTDTRNKFIELGLLYWANNPLWGNGLNSFGVLWGEDTYSHNNYIELLCSLGIVGLIAYYMIYIIPLVKTLKSYIKHNQPTIAFTLCMILSCLISDYAMVTYFERIPLMLTVLVYVFLKENNPRRRTNIEQYQVNSSVK